MNTGDCKCGRKANAHWLGKGDLCTDHFNEEYERMNHDDDRERREKIKKNFDEKVTAQKERR